MSNERQPTADRITERVNALRDEQTRLSAHLIGCWASDGRPSVAASMEAGIRLPNIATAYRSIAHAILARFSRGEDCAADAVMPALNPAERITLLRTTEFPNEVQTAFEAPLLRVSAEIEEFHLVEEFLDGGISRNELAASLVEAEPFAVTRVGRALTTFPPSVGDGPNAIFTNGYLRRGGSLMLAAPAGVGKSAFTIQASLLWSTGRAAFGIVPARPLRIAIIQAEDDDEEVGDFVRDIQRGFAEQGIQFDPSTADVRCYDCTGLVGDAFCDEGLAPIIKRDKPDLIIINPLFAYLGGDVSDQETVSHFLREKLQPLIAGKCAVLIVHHTNKPPKKAERTGYGSDAYAQYVGSGSAELNNFFRAVLALTPVEGEANRGKFRLSAAKRGNRLRWDPTGNPLDYVPTRYIGYSDGFVYWREVDPSEISTEAAKPEKPAPIDHSEEDADEMFRYLREHGDGTTYDAVKAYVGAVVPRERARAAAAAFARRFSFMDAGQRVLVPSSRGLRPGDSSGGWTVAAIPGNTRGVCFFSESNRANRANRAETNATENTPILQR